ncbi:hypothetical protein KW801_00410 [Candidatus Saccharibacteria bacterium]|nr:hypothetical protein [Candidatus Saccharibacteria bacterium]
MLRKFIVIAVASLTLALAASAVASASPSGFSLSVVPQVSFVSTGGNATVNYAVTNNTSSDASCYLHIEELNFDAPLGTIASGQSAGGQLSTPALYKNSKLTFDLMCNGSLVASRAVNIKVR